MFAVIALLVLVSVMYAIGKKSLAISASQSCQEGREAYLRERLK